MIYHKSQLHYLVSIVLFISICAVMIDLPQPANAATISLPEEISFSEGIDIAIGTGHDAGLSKLSFNAILYNIYTFIISLIASIALVALVWGGVYYIISLGDESKVARAKNIILYAIIGLIVAGLAELIRNAACYVAELTCLGDEATPSLFISRILALLNFLLIPAGAVAFGALLFSGYLYITSIGDESKVSRAKRTAFFAILGLIVIGLAGIIVNTVIGLLPK